MTPRSTWRLEFPYNNLLYFSTCLTAVFRDELHICSVRFNIEIVHIAVLISDVTKDIRTIQTAAKTGTSQLSATSYDLELA